ncbi:MAG: NAD(P)(+) transhydrogenase (Re/Si-specific) subunit beta, partial [Lacipirellulaceae bacterium]
MLENLLLLAETTTVTLKNGDLTVTEGVDAAVTENFAQIGYLVAAVLFILGIKGMTHPRTAVRGNLLGAVGMFVAVLVTVVQQGVSLPTVLAGIAVGGAGGMWLAKKVEMTQMPQLVALFNAFGGIASVFVAGAEVLKGPAADVDGTVAGLAAGLAGLIGAVTFSGSLVAAGKLQELPQFKKPWTFGGLQAVCGLLLLVGLFFVLEMVDNTGWEYFPLVILALVLGALLTLPIGGA